MSEATGKQPLLRRLGHWIAELVLVFIGVSAAFWLNNYQQHRQDMQRRDQILATLELHLQNGIESGRKAAAEEERQLAAFQHAVDAGKMPQLRPFVFITDYDPSDVATLLESGGVLLLNPDTLAALNHLQSVIRWGLARMARYQELSNKLIVPNLDKPEGFFYDPATKRLRKVYELYPEALQARVNFAHDLARAQAALLKRIEAERGHQPARRSQSTGSTAMEHADAAS